MTGKLATEEEVPNIIFIILCTFFPPSGRWCGAAAHIHHRREPAASTSMIG